MDLGYGRGHHDKVRTGGKAAKFGFEPARLPQMLTAAKAAGARVHGLHAHLGSGILDPLHWREVYAELASMADRVGHLSALNIGGGLGVAYQPDAVPLDLHAFRQALSELKAAFPQYALWLEPGRFLVAEAGVLLLHATQVVEKSGVRRIGADGGMNALMRPALYEAWHEIANLTRLHEAPGAAADVVGPICESGDVLGQRRHLPATTAEGDVLLVANTGAYGAVMANRYNLRALPNEEVLDG